MKKKVFKIVLIIILIVLIISLLIWKGYEKYLDENYSAIATVVSIRIGNVLTFVIDDENQFLDKGTYMHIDLKDFLSRRQQLYFELFHFLYLINE